MYKCYALLWGKEEKFFSLLIPVAAILETNQGLIRVMEDFLLLFYLVHINFFFFCFVIDAYIITQTKPYVSYLYAHACMCMHAMCTIIMR